MPSHFLFERAGFWAAVGGSLVTLGGVLTGVGVAQVTSTQGAQFWTDVWFDGGLTIVFIGAVMLLWALVLFTANRYVEARAQPVGGRLPAKPSRHDFEVLDDQRKARYAETSGIFLVHTWTASAKPDQKADVRLRLVQHRDGRLLQGKVKSVEYTLGDQFENHTQVVTASTANGFATEFSAYAPLLVLARVSFVDGHPPLILERYINFEVNRSASSQTGEAPDIEPISEIEGMLVRGYFQDQPVRPNEFSGLAQLLDLYRREPWTNDPPLEIVQLPQGDESGRQLWHVTLAPLKAYVVQADGTQATLQILKTALIKELIPRMRHWDKWH